MQRKHVLRVTPHREPFEHPGHCRAELYRLRDEQRELIWGRHLINNTAPVDAVVADSGKYVVTMDEWHQYGELPLVIYGRRGELIESHKLHSVENPYGGKYDRFVEGVRATFSGPNWRKNSLVFFGPRDETLFIRLRAGSTRIVRLKDGEVMTEGWYKNLGGPVRKFPKKDWESLVEFGKKRTAELSVEWL